MENLSKRKLIVIRGALGVGKSTIANKVAEKYSVPYLSLDKIIDDNGLSTEDGIPLENFIKSNDIVVSQSEGCGLAVLDGCFYYSKQIEDLKQKFAGDVIFITLYSSLEKCIERDSKRDKVYGKESAEFVFNMSDGIREGYYIDNENLTEEEFESFKSVVLDYLKKYAFISQIVTFDDPHLEKLYIFLKYLIRKLPKKENPLPYEVLEAINMESYRVEKKTDSNLQLENKEGVIEPMGSGKTKVPLEDETDALSIIIKEINERYGTSFNDGDRVILNDLSKRLLNNETLNGAVKNNSKDSAKLKFDQLFQDELVGVLDQHFSLYQKLDQSPELKKFVQDRVFEYVVRRMSI